MGRTVKLWIDDLRKDPDTEHAAYSERTGWVWAKSSGEAIALLTLRRAVGKKVDVIAFDHDLGGDDTTRPVMHWLIERDYWPATITVHTANPVGREWLVGMAKRYAPEGTEIAA